MTGYAKLFQSIVTSSIWTEDDQTRIAWVTMLAIADKHGEVHASIPGLARVAGVPVKACEAAIEKFLGPDKYSRTPDCEGRRIEPIDGGWAILNYQKYRRMASADDEREKATERKRRQRERDGHGKSRPVTDGHEPVTVKTDNADADADADAEKTDALSLSAREEASSGAPTGNNWETSQPTGSSIPQDEPEASVIGRDSSPANQTPPAASSGSNHPTLEEVKTTASMRGVPENVAELFWNDRESVGWVDGRGQPIHKWQSSLWAFWTRYQANEQKTKQLNEQRQRINTGPGSTARPDRVTGTCNENYVFPDHLITRC